MTATGKVLQRKPLDAPPDGGWGWMVVCAVFLILFIVRGIQNSVGVFFVVLLEHFQEGAGSTAWLTTCLTSLSLCTGPFAGALSNRFGHRRVVMFGGLLAATSIFVSAFATSITYLTMTFGILTGIGFGLARVPAVAMLGRYFKKRHALASGFGVVGSGAGSFIMAPLIRVIVDIYSWRGTFILMGGIALNICVGGALLRPIYLKDDFEDTTSPQPEKNEHTSHEETVSFLPINKHTRQCSKSLSSLASHFELGLFKDVMYVTLIICNMLFGFGLNIPLIHIVKRAVDVGVSESQSPLLLSVLGFTMMIGGFAQGFIVDFLHLSKCRVLGFVMSAYGVISLFLPIATDFITLCSLMALLGLMRGAYAALNSVVLRVIVGQSRFTAAYGTSLAFTGIAQLLGPVVAGYMYDQTQDYTVSFYMGGTTVLASGLLFQLARCIWERRNKRKIQKIYNHAGDDESSDEENVYRPDEALYVLIKQTHDDDDDEFGARTNHVVCRIPEDDENDCIECVPAIDLEKENTL